MGNDGSSPKTLIEMLMEVVAPIVVGIMVAIMLRTWALMPTWVCVLIALPVGTVLGWVAMIGLIVAISSVVDTITNRRTPVD